MTLLRVVESTFEIEAPTALRRVSILEDNLFGDSDLPIERGHARRPTDLAHVGCHGIRNLIVQCLALSGITINMRIGKFLNVYLVTFSVESEFARSTLDVKNLFLVPSAGRYDTNNGSRLCHIAIGKSNESLI